LKIWALKQCLVSLHLSLQFLMHFITATIRKESLELGLVDRLFWLSSSSYIKVGVHVSKIQILIFNLNLN